MYRDLKLKEMLTECIKCTLNRVNVVSLTFHSSVIEILVFCDVTLRHRLGGSRCYDRTHCLNLEGSGGQ